MISHGNEGNIDYILISQESLLNNLIELWTIVPITIYSVSNSKLCHLFS